MHCAMLMMLSGCEHEVLTAIALLDGERCESWVVTSRVRFRDISRDEAAAYWASGEPRDKAGGYGIRGLGAVFVAGLNGSYSAGGRTAALRNRGTARPFRHTLLANQ